MNKMEDAWEQEKMVDAEIEKHLDPALQSVSELQEILETSRLSSGMFLRLVVAFEEEESVAAAFAKKMEKIENVSCVEQKGTHGVTMLLYVHDPFSNHLFPERTREIICRNYEELALNALIEFQDPTFPWEAHNAALESLGINSCCVYYVTTNPGSSYVSVAGYFCYSHGVRNYDYDNFVCENEHLYGDLDTDNEDVRNFCRFYAMITGSEFIPSNMYTLNSNKNILVKSI